MVEGKISRELTANRDLLTRDLFISPRSALWLSLGKLQVFLVPNISSKAVAPLDKQLNKHSAPCLQASESTPLSFSFKKYTLVIFLRFLKSAHK